MTIFKLPDLGEGLPDAEIVEWHVKVGDQVEQDQKLVSMETAKAVVEIPSPFSGRIVKLYGNKGDIIKTASPLIEFEKKGAELEKVSENHTSEKSDAATVAGKLEVGNIVIKESESGLFTNQSANQSNSSVKPTVSVKATPAVRALATQLNVDINQVKSTGHNNIITSQDVERAAKQHVEPAANQNVQRAANQDMGHLANSSDMFEPLKGTRRIMAKVMEASHASVVPVSVFEDAKLIHWSEDQDVSVRLIQAIIAAHKKEPALNAWYNASFGRRVFPELNLGLAVDTEDGLFVPVIKNAESLNSQQLRQRIDNIKAQVTERSIPPEDLKGATITLSNFGKFSGRYSTPVVVPPMVAILGVGKLRQDVIAYQNSTQIVSVLPLSLTFDHRAVTGGEATRFLKALIDSLESK